MPVQGGVNVYNKGYTSPAVEFLEEEMIPEYNPQVENVYGIIGFSSKGPYEPIVITSISELHKRFGKSTDEEGMFYKAVATAERVLKYTSRIIFCRVEVVIDENPKKSVINDTIAFGYFENTEAVDVSVLIAPYGEEYAKYLYEAPESLGTETDETKWTAYMSKYTEINKKLIAVAEKRSDCVVILDYPEGTTFERLTKVITEEETYSSLDDDQCITYFPTVNIVDPYTGTIYEAPASSTGLRAMAYTDSKDYCWYAPAGYGNNRGVISDAVSCNAVLTKEERDTLYKKKVNPIVQFVGKGTVIMGDTTFKNRSTSATSPDSLYCQIGVRRLANYIKKAVVSISLETLFEPNDPLTWAQWKNRVEPILNEIKANRGIEDFKVKMDRTTITDEDISNNRAPGIIYVKPIGAIEFISIRYVVTQDDTYFVEEEE